MIFMNMKQLKKIIIVFALCVGLILLVVNLNKNIDEIHINHIEITNSHQIYNNTSNKFYDTLFSVGLKILEIQDTVFIRHIPESFLEQTPDNYNGFIIPLDKYYIIYLKKDLNKDELFEVVSHELIHLQQFKSKRIIIMDNGIVQWEGKDYSIDKINYHERPWEIEAFRYQYSLSIIMKDILILKKLGKS